MEKAIIYIKKYWSECLFILSMIVFMSGVLFFLCGIINNTTRKIPPHIIYVDNVDITPNFMFKEPKEGLREALEYYHIKHANIVYAQAILETGNFTSYYCTKYNNLFGLYNSKSKDFFKFRHWTESIEAYAKYVQYKYNSGDYYMFLSNLGYAKDKEYISKLKEIVNSNK